MSTDVAQHTSKALEALREMLAGNVSFEKTVLAVRDLPRPPANEDSDPTIGWFYTQADPAEPTCLKIAPRSARDEVCAALRLSISTYGAKPDQPRDGVWRIVPYLSYPNFTEEENLHDVCVPDDWVHQLLCMVKGVFNDIEIRPDPKNAEVRKSAKEQVFLDRIREFKRGGPRAFFIGDQGHDPEDKTTVKSDNPANAVTKEDARCGWWEILSRWNDWNRKGVFAPKQRRQILEGLGYTYSQEYFTRLYSQILRLKYVGPGSGKGRKKE